MRVKRELEVEKVVGLERDLCFDQEANMLSSNGAPIQRGTVCYLLHHLEVEL